jgi:hypothetical protein
MAIVGLIGVISKFLRSRQSVAQSALQLLVARTRMTSAILPHTLPVSAQRDYNATEAEC